MIRFRWIVTPLVITYLFLVVIGLGVAAVTVDSIRKDAILPYTFTEDIYPANKFEVCPGNTVAWKEEMVVNNRFSAVVANSFVSGDAYKSQLIGHTGRQLFFGERGEINDYYQQRGYDIGLPSFPFTITHVLTATVPALVEDDYLMIVFTSVYGDRVGDTYRVPLWVLSAAECARQIDFRHEVRPLELR